ncbi:hypothetical protein MLD38_020524 [Melastoma candidum]|uniref:Uncharacterized protein n=1 Tax=Melastoma candidum TaxID=119954 RepID=A0ACB9QDP1_9MYRT|nr:hypothetical protein MLD38_020524 [Melastoma candidum]
MKMSQADIQEIDRLPDDFLLILSYVSTDIKSLVPCSVVSRRFRLLVSLVPFLRIHVDRSVTICYRSLPLAIRILVSDITLEPLRCVGYESSSFAMPLFPGPSPTASPYTSSAPSTSTYLSPPSPFCRSQTIHSALLPSSATSATLHFFHLLQLLQLHFHLPSSIQSFTYQLHASTSSSSSPTLLHWHAHFGSSLHRCLILVAASSSIASRISNEKADVADYDSVPRKFYKMISMAWSTVALTAASSRHYRIQQTVKEHANIEGLVVTDADGQGVFRMDRDQLKELRKGPIVLASSALRTMVPSTRIGGTKGEAEMGLGWIKEEFDGMYAEAARVVLKWSPHHHYEEIESF